MAIQVFQTALEEIEAMRDDFRREARCQIVRDSILPRGLADPWLVLIDGVVSGYGGVWAEHFPGRLMEFHASQGARSQSEAMFRELTSVTKVTHVEAQTNLPLMLTMLYRFARNFAVEAVLFGEARPTGLVCPGAVVRRAKAEDSAFVFEHHSEPIGEWVVEMEGEIAATGGFLTHYNPPYADLFVEVASEWRRKGLGSFLVQELKHECFAAGFIPAARCDPRNAASRRTLLKAGLTEVGRLLVGELP